MGYDTYVTKGENPMTTLDMLMAREELLRQVEFTVDGELDGIVSDALRYELIRRLSDKVCEQFPAQEVN